MIGGLVQVMALVPKIARTFSSPLSLDPSIGELY